VEAIIYSMILLSNGIVERVYGLKKFLALRYIVHKKQQQTFEKICDEITGTKNHELGRRTCIVAYGDASFSSSGRAGSNVLSTPTNKLLKKIMSRTQTVMIDEHRTSVTCFRCDHETTEHSLTEDFRTTQFLERNLPQQLAGEVESEETKLERIKQNKRSAGFSRIRLCSYCLAASNNQDSETNATSGKPDVPQPAGKQTQTWWKKGHTQPFCVCICAI
jgi:hypothetical protein